MRIFVKSRTSFFNLFSVSSSIRFFFFLGATVLFDNFLSNLFAQNNQNIHVLDAIVVTGTKTAKSVKEGPVKTDLINHKHIKERHYKDVSEVILDIPGVTLNNIIGKQGKSAIMQGLGGDHVLLVIDGAPVAQNANGGFDLSQIPIDQIAQIEVVKGGASALYGGQAMGGVINIITKKPKETIQYGFETQRDQYLEQTPEEEVGYNSLSAHVGKRHKNTAYQINFANQKNSNIDRDNKTITRDSPDLEKLMGNLWLSQKINSTQQIYVDYNHMNEENTSYIAKLQPNSAYKAVQNINQTESKRLKLGHDSTFSQFNLNTYGLYEDISDEISMGDDPATNYDEFVKTSSLIHQRVEVTSNIPIGDNHIETLGMVLDQNVLKQKSVTAIDSNNFVESTEIDDKLSQIFEIYGQDDWILPHNEEIITGVRYTQDEFFGNNLSPKINYSKNLKHDSYPDSVIRASIGSGFRVPNLKERFYFLDHRSFAGYMVLGNEDLKPETSVSYQLGWEISQKNFFSINVNTFLNNVSGLIMAKEINTDSSQRTFTYDNIDNARIYGLELSGDYFFKERFTFTQSFTHTTAENDNDGLIIPQRPFVLTQTMLKYTFDHPHIDLIYTNRYFGEAYANVENTRRQKDYHLSDLRMNYHGNKNYSYFLGVKNIFNQQREPMKDVIELIYDQRPELGRSIFLGFNYDV